MSTQYRLVQSGKTASGGCSAGQGLSEPVAPLIIIIIIIIIITVRYYIFKRQLVAKVCAMFAHLCSLFYNLYIGTRCTKKSFEIGCLFSNSLSVFLLQCEKVSHPY
jgi:hypothetical protein